MKKKNVSIVIPILNEGKNIIQLVKQIKNVINKINIDKFELIFIDDNSSDNTHNLLKKIVKSKKFVRYYIRRNLKPDLSKSCVLGFDKAKYENILVMDGDLQHPPKYIKNITEKFFIKNADIVVGSRNLINKKNTGLSIFRYISSILIIYVINFFLENKSSDPLSGFFIFKKQIYKKNKYLLFNKGYKILADLIFSSDQKLIIMDQDIFFQSRKFGRSKMNFLVLLQLLIFILRSFLLKWRRKILD